MFFFCCCLLFSCFVYLCVHLSRKFFIDFSFKKKKKVGTKKKLCIFFYANEGIKSNKNKYYKYLSDIVAVIMYHKGLFFNTFLCFGTTETKQNK